MQAVLFLREFLNHHNRGLRTLCLCFLSFLIIFAFFIALLFSFLFFFSFLLFRCFCFISKWDRKGASNSLINQENQPPKKTEKKINKKDFYSLTIGVQFFPSIHPCVTLLLLFCHLIIYTMHWWRLKRMILKKLWPFTYIYLTKIIFFESCSTSLVYILISDNEWRKLLSSVKVYMHDFSFSEFTIE